MAKKLTDQATEAPFKEIIESDQIYEIPYFQRGYKWKGKQKNELIQDIDQILQGEEPVHFLGTIILHKKQTGATETNMFEIIDGQQRLTTLYLLCLAIVNVYIRNKQYDEASFALEQLIILKKTRQNASNLKLWPGRDDRQQFNDLHRKIWDHKGFHKHIVGQELKLLPDSGPKKGAITKMHGQLVTEVGRYFNGDDGFNDVKNIYEIINNKLHFINILVNEASNSTKFFERMNARGIKVSTGELVRNEIFSRVAANDPAEADELFENHWLPFYEKFKETRGTSADVFDHFLFIITLIKDPSQNKSSVFEYLRAEWKGKTPIQIIDDMKKYQGIYIQLRRNEDNKVHDNFIKVSKDLYVMIDRYVRADSPTTTLPFFVNLLYHYKEEELDKIEVKKIFASVESYLVRRGVLGIEPTGLHAIFKDLWNRMDKKTAETAEKIIRDTKTMVWPSDDEFNDKLNNRELYGVGVTKYILEEYELSLKGDYDRGDFDIEHIMPQTRNNQWDYIDQEDHAKYLHLIGNLLPITPIMNKSIKNFGFDHKRKRYKEDSKFKSTRQLGEDYEKWGIEEIKVRQKKIIQWAKKRWPI
tara:strand:+ start:240 stop:1997 length:1758 start_codon:yes stop_codon:yes gene_type:complete